MSSVDLVLSKDRGILSLYAWVFDGTKKPAWEKKITSKLVLRERKTPTVTPFDNGGDEGGRVIPSSISIERKTKQAKHKAEREREKGCVNPSIYLACMRGRSTFCVCANFVLHYKVRHMGVAKSRVQGHS